MLLPHEICPVDGELVEGGPPPRTLGAWAPFDATPHARGDGAAPAHPHEQNNAHALNPELHTQKGSARKARPIGQLGQLGTAR